LLRGVDDARQACLHSGEAVCLPHCRAAFKTKAVFVPLRAEKLARSLKRSDPNQEKTMSQTTPDTIPEYGLTKVARLYREAKATLQAAEANRDRLWDEHQLACTRRNTAADLLDLAIVEYSAARTARRNAGQALTEYGEALLPARTGSNQTFEALLAAAENGDAEDLHAAGTKYSGARTHWNTLSNVDWDALNTANTDANLRFERAEAGKTAAQEALDEADNLMKLSKIAHENANHAAFLARNFGVIAAAEALGLQACGPLVQTPGSEQKHRHGLLSPDLRTEYTDDEASPLNVLKRQLTWLLLSSFAGTTGTYGSLFDGNRPQPYEFLTMNGPEPSTMRDINSWHVMFQEYRRTPPGKNASAARYCHGLGTFISKEKFDEVIDLVLGSEAQP
jgi:hypothetical protein